MMKLVENEEEILKLIFDWIIDSQYILLGNDVKVVDYQKYWKS